MFVRAGGTALLPSLTQPFRAAWEYRATNFAAFIEGNRRRPVLVALVGAVLLLRVVAGCQRSDAMPRNPNGLTARREAVEAAQDLFR